MQVAKAVEELERKYEEMRVRAERAEGTIRLYEARDETRVIAAKAKSDDRWRIHWAPDDDEPTSFVFSPGLWLLGLTEAFLRKPQPFQLRVEEVADEKEKPDA